MAGTNPKSSTSSSSSAARAFPRFCMIAHLVVCLCAPAYGGGGGAGEDYEQEQEMEVEALQAILMDDIKEIDPSESGLSTTARCFQIVLSPQDDDFDESAYVPVQLALIFAHTEKYPDEPPLLNVKSVRGMKSEDLASLKEKLEQEATENLGMAMVYTLVTSAQDWLSEKYGQNAGDGESEENEAEEEEVIVPHGEAVTVESFLAWRDRFEAELALQRAKLMPESALTAPKEKKLSGRQYFESGRHTMKGASTTADEEEEEEEDIDFDEDFDDDEEDMLEHYLAEQSGKSAA
ncbi:hypothetical protein OsI_02417 [Oryza sativa Indica Group]|uniref:RWD domain-containing protein n=2 Tax=Oryza sativa TaxID=4530 RepID=A2ZUD3_ORYSJ|nr:hypothetical protein OsI_02417 [Oryza sativa Indica Group]EAZ12330.1 hypothetical protein OsJ_02219 [Oryza sativa Japonica Group]